MVYSMLELVHNIVCLLPYYDYRMSDQNAGKELHSTICRF